jgi:hypothetical protein
MLKRSLPILLVVTLGSVSCTPPEPVPPPRFMPTPPFAPEPVYPDEPQNDVSPPPPPSPQPPPTATGGYPTAQRTANPDQVLSPYEPYNVIDVAGFKSGQLARDPSNQKIFRIP